MRSNAFLSALLPGALSALLACGGSSKDPARGGFTNGAQGSPGGFGSLSGTVAGTTFAVGSVVGGLHDASDTATCSTTIDAGQTCTTKSSGEVVGVLLTNRADATCSFIQSEATSSVGLSLASYDVLELTITSPDGSVAPGTYPLEDAIGATMINATATLSTTDAMCFERTNYWGTGGTITLTEVSPSVLAGTYDVTFGTQGSLQGSFNVGVCYLTDAGVTPSDGGGPVCKP